MARPVNIGLVQFLPERWEVKKNWQRLKGILDGISRGELDLIVTPECIVDGYAVSEGPKNQEEDWPDRERWLRECAIDPSEGGVLREAGELAGNMEAYLVLGYTELIGPSRAANAASVFDRGGKLVGTYHKTHLQRHDLQFEAGQGWTLVDADFGRFSVLICADRRWPEAVRCQRLLGAEMLANPTYGMHGDLNLAMMRTRSYENGFFIAFAHPKRSLITGPDGKVEIDVRSAEDTLVCHILDLDRLEDSHIKDRRRDLYAESLLR